MYENNIFETIANEESVVIAGHTSPDGDAVGAALSLALCVAQKGIRPIVLLEEYAERFDFISGSEYVFGGDYDTLSPKVFIAVDSADKSRLGKASAVFERAEKTFNIDHHISNTRYADVNIVNGKASSASEIVYEIVSKECNITLDIATAAYSGIVFDTSGFKHGSTSARTHVVAGELVALGVDTAFIHSKILFEHSISQFKVMRSALANAVVMEDCGISCSALTKAQLDECGAKNGDTDGVAEYLLNIRGVQTSALLTEREMGKTKISLRSKKYNVNKVAAAFGGGGHILASGASTDLPLDEALKAVIAKIKEEMNEEQQQ